MATLVELVDREELVRFDPELEPHQFEIRRVFMLPRVPEQIDERIADAVSDRQINTLPMEQLDQLLVDFSVGTALAVETQFKCLQPVGHGVWELKTADVRMFGWFDTKDCFVCAAADTAYRVKHFNLYQGYISEVARLRDALLAPDGQYVEGNEPDDVLSNWY